jgi:hypothetical protein
MNAIHISPKRHYAKNKRMIGKIQIRLTSQGLFSGLARVVTAVVIAFIFPAAEISGQKIILTSGSFLSNNGATITIDGNVENEGSISNSGIVGFSISNNFMNTGSFIAGEAVHNIGGDLINHGTFSGSGSTIIFDGAVPQLIGGTTGVGFGNIRIETGSNISLITGGHSVSGILLCNGVVEANGNLTLLSTSQNTALINGAGTGQVNGNLTMQRYLNSGFGYRYISSPFQSSTVNQLADDIDLVNPFPSVYRYDESRVSSGWVSYTDPLALLNPLNGYAVFFGSSNDSLTADISGIVNNGALSVTLHNNNNSLTAGFNLVGNPYPSPIDWDSPSGWTRSNIDDAVYYFKASTTDEYSGIYSTYMGGVSSDGAVGNIIPSMQGFFVHVSDGSFPVTGTLGLTNNVRITDKAHSFTKSSDKSGKPYLRLVAGYSDDSLSFDPLVIYFDETATYNFDGKLDALKLFNTDMSVTNFYSFGDDGSQLSINALPMDDVLMRTIRLGVKTERGGEVTFRIKSLEGDLFYQKISLTDLVTGETNPLQTDTEYRVYLAEGHYLDRFFLNFSNTATDISNQVADKDLFHPYSSEGILKVEINIPLFVSGSLTVYNLLGQAVYITKVYDPGYHEFIPGIKDGIYIITLDTGLIRTSKKLYFHGN